MQYKRQAMPIARGKSTRANILPMLLRSAYCLLVMLPALCVGGCADSMPDAKPLKRFTDLVRGYDSTLTSAEKQAVISELQKDKERQQEQLDQGEGAPKAN
jgi:hypothetical protein